MALHGSSEGAEHGLRGHVLVAAHVHHGTRVVVQEREDLDLATRTPSTAGELVVGHVGLPALVGHLCSKRT